MAIVNMTKFQLLSFQRDQEALLKKMQEFNYVHFNKPVLIKEEEEEEEEKQAQESSKASALTAQANEIKHAMDLVKPYSTKPKGLAGLKAGNQNVAFKELAQKVANSGWEKTYRNIEEVSTRLSELSSKESKLRVDLEEVENWSMLDFDPEDLLKLKRTQGFFGTVPRKIAPEFEAGLRKLDLSYAREVGGTKNDVWYLLLSHPKEDEALEETLRQFAFSKTTPEFKGTPLEEKKRLNQAIIDLKAEQRNTKDELKAFAQGLPDLELAYEYTLNERNRVLAQEEALTTQFTSLTEGFIPTEMESEFKETLTKTLGDKYSLHMEPALKDDPEVPIILKNNKFNSAFTDVTAMYALPKYNEMDPTPWLAPFYFIFFGMMIADMGYGLLMFIATLFARKKFNLSKGTRKFADFFFYLSIPTFLWGVIYGSFFSLELGLPQLLNPGQDFMTIMIISIIFGAIHLFLGLGLKGYLLLRDGHPMDAVFDVLLWYMALTGGIVFLLGAFIPAIPPLATTIAKWVMIIGMVGIVLFAARDSKKIGPRLAGGLYSLYGISSWIGDFVSYSRLMALGLSGGFIGMAFNMMAGMVSENNILLIPFTILIFLVGHVFNLLLSILSAYVHTLRLTYVEFFGKFYEGGGKPFKTMRQEPKYINYTDQERFN